MAKTNGVNLETRHWDALEEMQEDGVAESRSEAVRAAVDAGLAELGYLYSDGGETWLAWFTGELAKVLAFMAVGWLGATLLFPVAFRLPAVYLFGASVACFGMERLLAADRGTVREKVAGAFSRGERA